MGDGIKGPGMSLQTHWCHGAPSTPSSVELYPSMGTPFLCAPLLGLLPRPPFLSHQCHPKTQPPLLFAVRQEQYAMARPCCPSMHASCLVSLLCPPHVVLQVIRLNFALLPWFCSCLQLSSCCLALSGPVASPCSPKPGTG